MSDTHKVMQMIKEHDVKYVDFRFTDPRGKWQHLATMCGRSPRIFSMTG